MNILRLLNRSLATTIFLNVALVLLWLLSAFWLETEKNDVEIIILESIYLFSLPYFWSVIAQLIYFMLLAFFVYKAIFLQYLNTTSYLPFSVLMLFGTFLLNSHLFGNQTFATMFWVLALWQSIKIIPGRDNQLVVLNTFLLLMLSTFFVPEFIYFTPIFIFSFIYFVEFKIKSLLIIIFSILMPILCIFGICFLLDKIDLFQEFFVKRFNFNFEINTAIFEPKVLIVEIISVIFALVSLFLYSQNIRNYKFQTRRVTFFFVILWLSTIFFMFLKNNFLYFILIYIIVTTFFIALSFTNLQPKKTKKIKRKQVIKMRKFKRKR